MNDFELNEAIAKVLGEFTAPPAMAEQEIIGDVLCYYEENRTIAACHYDYIARWECLMPLVVEHEINFRYAREINAYEVYNHLSEQPFHHCVSKDPQRALAECLLKVLGAK